MSGTSKPPATRGSSKSRDQTPTTDAMEVDQAAAAAEAAAVPSVAATAAPGAQPDPLAAMQMMLQKMQEQMEQQKQQFQQQEREKAAMQHQYEEQLAEIKQHMATSAIIGRDHQQLVEGGMVGVGEGVGGPHNNNAAAQVNQAELLRRLAELQPGSPSAPKLKAIEPERLTYKAAADKNKLEEWIFTAEQMLQQQKLAAAPLERQLQLIKLFWDQALNKWWDSADKVKKQQGNAIVNWKQLQLLMRSTFLSTVDEDTAVAEIRRAEMKAKEGMGEYTQRIAALYDRISEERVTSQMAAELLAEGVQPARFPLLVAAYKKEQSEHRKVHNGRGMHFDTVRERLMELSKAEPAEVVAAARKEQQAAASGGGGWPSSKSHGKKPQAAANAQSLVKQLNAIAASAGGEGEESEELSEAGKQFLQALVRGNQPINKKPVPAAAAAASGQQLQCLRCGGSHAVWECTEPDNRTCYKCHERGHIAKNCTSTTGTTRPAAQTGKPAGQSKNE